MIRLLGAITGSALALAALLVLVGVPQFKAEPSDIVRSVVTLPLRVEPVEEIIEAPAVVEEQAAVEVEPAATETLATPMAAEVAALVPDTQQWYAFWSPFRSEIAAAGFVAQLQRVTGLDYRVVKIKPGVYEVAFAYADDTDIPINLSQISAATGLDMPGG
jgi:hypothetical protein